jgi:hypothetical protein
MSADMAAVLVVIKVSLTNPAEQLKQLKQLMDDDRQLMDDGNLWMMTGVRSVRRGLLQDGCPG